MLRGVLNNHPELAIPLESLFIADYLRVADRIPLDKLKSLILREPELIEWGIEVALDMIEECTSISDVIARLHEIYSQAREKPRWGQKTPRLVRHHELIRLHFPASKFIHMVRDPRAVVSSLVRSDVHRSTVWHASKRWVRDVKVGLAMESRFTDSVLRVRYEDLVLEPVSELQNILEFLGAEPFIMRPSSSAAGTEYSEFYSNIHANLSSSITSDYADQWKRHLSQSDVDQVESIVGTLPQQLGYSAGSQIIPNSPEPSVRIILQRSFGLGAPGSEVPSIPASVHLRTCAQKVDARPTAWEFFTDLNY